MVKECHWEPRPRIYLQWKIDDETGSEDFVRVDEDGDKAANKVLAVDDEVSKGIVVASDRDDEGDALARCVVNFKGDGREGRRRRARTARRSILVSLVEIEKMR